MANINISAELKALLVPSTPAASGTITGPGIDGDWRLTNDITGVSVTVDGGGQQLAPGDTVIYRDRKIIKLLGVLNISVRTV